MNTFTLVHVLLSLVGIASGLVMVGGWLGGRQLRGWITTYLLTTIATSVTAFFFPNTTITPGIILGILSLLVLAVSLFALLVKKNAGRWLIVFAITATFALYLNFFVLIAQLFLRLPALHALPQPAFAISQLLTFVMFLTLGITAIRRLWPLSSTQ